MKPLLFIGVCLLGTFVICCLIPYILQQLRTEIYVIVRRRQLYKAYLQRLDDFEQYHKYMERCERDYQVKWLLDIQEQAKKLRSKAN